jgi:hypothetical protein
MQSAQLPRLMKMMNKGAGSRHATSCRPDEAAWRVALTRFARSLSYQESASSASAKPGGGPAAPAGSSGMS